MTRPFYESLTFATSVHDRPCCTLQWCDLVCDSLAVIVNRLSTQGPSKTGCILKTGFCCDLFRLTAVTSSKNHHVGPD
jgi:hypothetical protein